MRVHLFSFVSDANEQINMKDKIIRQVNQLMTQKEKDKQKEVH